MSRCTHTITYEPKRHLYSKYRATYVPVVVPHYIIHIVSPGRSSPSTPYICIRIRKITAYQATLASARNGSTAAACGDTWHAEMAQYFWLGGSNKGVTLPPPCRQEMALEICFPPKWHQPHGRPWPRIGGSGPADLSLAPPLFEHSPQNLKKEKKIRDSTIGLCAQRERR